MFPAARSVTCIFITACRSTPGRGRRDWAGAFNLYSAKSGGGCDFEILHVRRVVEKIMGYAGLLVNAIARGDEHFLIAIHEPGPAFGHEYNVEIGHMPVPARAAALGREIGVGFYKLGDDAPARSLHHAEVAVQEKLRSPSVRQGVPPGFTWEKRFTNGLSSIGPAPFAEEPVCLHISRR